MRRNVREARAYSCRAETNTRAARETVGIRVRSIAIHLRERIITAGVAVESVTWIVVGGSGSEDTFDYKVRVRLGNGATATERD